MRPLLLHASSKSTTESPGAGRAAGLRQQRSVSVLAPGQDWIDLPSPYELTAHSGNN
jgi:hypothetical protein